MIEPFRDPGQPLAARVDDLLGRLTLREKVGQLNQRLLGWDAYARTSTGFVTTEALDAEVERWGGLGALYGLQRADAWSGRDWSTGIDPDAALEVTALVQKRVVAGSRLGIPALFVEEAPHGHQALGAQLFPTNLGVAATFRPDLLEAAAAHTARELRARGAHLALVSGLDILRDPRWGRCEECFGEDPLLAARCVRALVRGYRTLPGLGVVLKHFAGQGAAMGGRNGSGTPIGPRELAEIHLPAAQAGVAEGALGVMAAYNDLDGVPCTANVDLLTRILRDEWGFEGIVMADMFAIDRLQRAGLSPTWAAAVALRAGVDLSMADVSYTALEEAVNEGLVAEALVDRACARVLGLKIRLGLLDAPRAEPSFPPPNPLPDLVAAAPVLLKNRNDTLPLAGLPARVAVIGPNADDVDCLLGDYVPPLPPGAGASVFDGLRARASGEVLYEPGCRLTEPIEGGLARAAALAADTDLVVLVLGSSSVRQYSDAFDANGAANLEGNRPAATTGEGFDAAEVRLPAAQRELAMTVAEAVRPGTRIVTVIVSGRPHGIGAVAAVADAVLYAWYLGPTGGTAIAELILGDREPVGRLPVSLPAASATLPVAYNERLETTRRYIDAEATAEYPFGAGLGYTTWTLDGDVLTNTGPRRGTQLIQLYGRMPVPGQLPRRAILAGFTHVTLDPGESRAVTVPVDPSLSGPLELWLSITGAATTTPSSGRNPYGPRTSS
jgi:beta-glucosidase